MRGVSPIRESREYPDQKSALYDQRSIQCQLQIIVGETREPPYHRSVVAMSVMRHRASCRQEGEEKRTNWSAMVVVE